MPCTRSASRSPNQPPRRWSPPSATAAGPSSAWAPPRWARLGATRIFITPGHRLRTADHLLTNFHLPESTLFVLVSALLGLELAQATYVEAIRERYRFFSYGDAMLILNAR